jgi:hypothetical protein
MPRITVTIIWITTTRRIKRIINVALPTSHLCTLQQLQVRSYIPCPSDPSQNMACTCQLLLKAAECVTYRGMRDAT